jgi:hypothetical protein
MVSQAKNGRDQDNQKMDCQVQGWSSSIQTTHSYMMWEELHVCLLWTIMDVESRTKVI